MRLLKYNNPDELVLTSFPDRGKVPPYAILSHTWSDGKEVTFDELANGTGKDKEGYEKIVLCGQQALRDNLQYFWVDTCCIDKFDKIELRTAINSMFRWYQKATKSYVYLPDVSSHKRKADGVSVEVDWEFRKSRWFTRGWTLQELVAPASSQIHGVTGIPESVLEGASILQFTVNERLLWKEGRQTGVEEDEAYALIGILGVNVTSIYGEGKKEAFRRVLDETRALENCIRELYSTDPRDDKRRIQDTKGGLLEDSYRWVLKNPEFLEWHESDEKQFLWVKGDPGKGKTMLLCGIIDELSRSLGGTDLLAYFFCQATDTRINNAVSILRGLLYMLVHRKPSLAEHIRKKYDRSGSNFFQDSNAWLALSEIFMEVLDDPDLDDTYLIIDALDECVPSDLSKLLDLLTRKPATTSRVKVIVSSRNVPDIEEKLEAAQSKSNLSLELNVESVSTAVKVFIDHRVSKLAEEKKYDKKIQEAVVDHLSSNAHDTFLWVALACQGLASVSKWNVIKKLNQFPPGLDSLYERMIKQVGESDDADRCKEILALAILFYRPVTIDELGVLAEQLEDIADDPESIRQIVGHCGSFLVLRENTIYFVHQSAQEYLSKQESRGVLSFREEYIHRSICSKSLQAMSKTLRRDMYGLRKPGYLAAEIQRPNPDPLAPIRYSSIYWVNHLCASKDTASLGEGGAVEVFLKTRFLYLLEALSILRSMPDGVISVTKLKDHLSNEAGNNSLNALVYDAYRFIMQHKTVIENAPLQAYSSALVFSPIRSSIRLLFQKEEPRWFEIVPRVAAGWSTILQTFECRELVVSLAFSSDSTRLTSVSNLGNVISWDLRSGECLKTFHLGFVWKLAVLSPDLDWLATTSPFNLSIKLWKISNQDVTIKASVKEFKGHTDEIDLIEFSPDSSRLASLSSDSSIRIWDTSNGECMVALMDPLQSCRLVTFSNDSSLLAIASLETIWVYDLENQSWMWARDDIGYVINSMAFSHDSNRLQLAVNEAKIMFLEPASGKTIGTRIYHTPQASTWFSHNSTKFASISHHSKITLWNTRNGRHAHELRNQSFVTILTFSHNAKLLASASHDGIIQIWDTTLTDNPSTHESHGLGGELILSPDVSRLASIGLHSIRLFGTRTMTFLRDLKLPKYRKRLSDFSNGVARPIFSLDSGQIAAVMLDKTSRDNVITIWDTTNGDCLQEFTGHDGHIIAFAYDPACLGSLDEVGKIRIWDTGGGKCHRIFDSNNHEMRRYVGSLAFSRDLKRLASAYGPEIKLWNITNGECLLKLEGDSDIGSLVFSNDYTSTWLASLSRKLTLKIWNTDEGTCLQTISLKWDAKLNSLDATNSLLHTDMGIIKLSPSRSENTNPDNSESMTLQLEGLSVNDAMDWITYNSENIVWLPPDYRGDYITISGNTIAMTNSSERIWVFKVQDPGQEISAS